MTHQSKIVGGCCTPGHRSPGAVLPTDLPPNEGLYRAPESLHAERSTMDHGNRISLPGGTFLMGTDYPCGFPQDGEGPVREVTLQPFTVDTCAVSNKHFARFIQATGYRTEAERFGWSFVFCSHLPTDKSGDLILGRDPKARWWCAVRQAQWDQPEGPGSSVENRTHHPVVHVSWNDAQAYCLWAGSRLPTEAEWEYVARGGLEQKLYPWGDSLTPDGVHRCNIWQGNFPSTDSAEDGYAGTCPVDTFGPNAFGLFCMTGNVWEWCSDWFSPDYHRSSRPLNPTGPSQGVARTLKGGSFLCHASYCNRYRVAARSSNTPDSSSSNLGFRCFGDSIG